jgi:hypothetical protein
MALAIALAAHYFRRQDFFLWEAPSPLRLTNFRHKHVWTPILLKSANLPDGRQAKAAIRLENHPALGLPFHDKEAVRLWPKAQSHPARLRQNDHWVLHIDRFFFDVTRAEQVLVNDAAAGPMKDARPLSVIPQQVSLVGR